jgi:enolase-phosphatase E1
MNLIKNFKVILMDVEGTTTSKDFVFKVLFPFSLDNLSTYLQNHFQEEHITLLIEKLALEQNWNLKSQDDLLKKSIELLELWIKEDKKHPVLKSIQGLIWEEGYKSGNLKSHVYDDVPECFRKWSQMGKTLVIYSSGSVLAQKLLFQYCEKGDLTPYLTAHFDTSVGHKREESSYQNIANILKVNPSEILFLSDIEEELMAAKNASMGVVLINRDQSKSSGQFLEVNEFNKI